MDYAITIEAADPTEQINGKPVVHTYGITFDSDSPAYKYIEGTAVLGPEIDGVAVTRLLGAALIKHLDRQVPPIDNPATAETYEHRARRQKAIAITDLEKAVMMAVKAVYTNRN